MMRRRRGLCGVHSSRVVDVVGVAVVVVIGVGVVGVVGVVFLFFITYRFGFCYHLPKTMIDDWMIG